MNLYTLVSQIPPVYFSLALAAIICFLGYPLHKLGILVTGGVLGFFVGRDFALQFFDQNASNTIGLVLGFVTAILCLVLYKVGRFIFCGAVGAMFLSLVLPSFSLESWLQSVLLVVIFLAAGGLSVKFMRPVIILVTGLLGGINLLSGLLLLGVPIPAGLWQVFSMLALAGLGIFIQFSITK